METRSLELFLDVMHDLSFTKVGRKNGIDPSSVSRIIANLEATLGFRLFQRSTRKLSPTEAGAVYYQRVVPLLADLKLAQEVALDIHSQPRGILRVSASATYAQRRIVPLLPHFLETHPALSIELILTDRFVDLIEEKIDVAIRLGKPRDSSYIHRSLSPLTFKVVASPAYLSPLEPVVAPSNLSEHTCLHFPRSRSRSKWLFRKEGKVEEISHSGRCLITNSDAIRMCAVAGMGIALLPDWLVEEDIASGNLTLLLPDYEASERDFDRSIHLLYPSREYLTLKTEAFIALLLNANLANTEK